MWSYIGTGMVISVRFVTQTFVKVPLLFFWVVTPRRHVGRYQLFRETCFNAEDEESMFFRNAGNLRVCMAS
jgi:hypothetical protein